MLPHKSYADQNRKIFDAIGIFTCVHFAAGGRSASSIRW
jgi:hypothetical protein